MAGTEPRLGCRFWGVNYEKGACTSPLFHFCRSPVLCGPESCLTSPKASPLVGLRRPRFLRRSESDSAKPKVRPSMEPYRRQLPPLCLRTVNCGLCTKKMSGRWGHRPLGRGDGGNSNPKSVWFFWPFYCAREQQDDRQEHTGDYRCMTPESPNHFRLHA